MSNSARWQPIATAPHNREVLVRSADGCVSVARYRKESGEWRAFADGYDAHLVHGHRIVIGDASTWADIPDDD